METTGNNRTEQNREIERNRESEWNREAEQNHETERNRESEWDREAEQSREADWTHEAEWNREAEDNNGTKTEDMPSANRRGISFYRDAAHRYLVLSCGNKNTDNYRYRMLAVNQIPGLLSCDLRYIEAACCVYYDVAGKQSLEECADAGKLTENVCFSLIRELIRTEKKLSEYLLDAAGLLLNPAYIYEDPQKGSWYFAYNPSEERIQEDVSLNGLAEFLALRIDMTCRKAAALTLRLCMLSSNPNFILDESILEEEDDETQMGAMEYGEQGNGKRGAGTENVKTQAADSFSGDSPEMFPEYDLYQSEWDGGREKTAETLPSEEDASEMIEPKHEITLAIFLWGLAIFVGWFGNIMRLKNQEKVLDLAAAGTMAVCGVYFAAKHIVRWVRSKTK